MSTTSRRLAAQFAAANGRRPSHTPGKTKGGNCVRPKDFGIATNGNPYKGAGLKGGNKSKYVRLWDRYKSAKGNS